MLREPPIFPAPAVEYFFIAFRSKPGVPFRFFLCFHTAMAEANRRGVLW